MLEGSIAHLFTVKGTLDDLRSFMSAMKQAAYIANHIGLIVMALTTYPCRKIGFATQRAFPIRWNSGISAREYRETSTARYAMGIFEKWPVWSYIVRTKAT